MTFLMVYFSLHALPIIFINAGFVVVLLWHGKKTKVPESRRDGFFLAGTYALSVVITPFLLNDTGCTNAGQDFLFLLGTLFFGSVLSLLVIIVVRNRVINNRNPRSKEELTYERFLAAIPVGDDTRRDISRKVLHIIISVTPIIVYAIVFNADAFFKSQNILQEYGVSGLGAGRGVNVLIYWGFAYMVTFEDLFRLNAFYCLPGWGRTWLRFSLEQKERLTFVAAVPFLLGHAPFLMAPFPVFFSMTFVASVGDAASSMVGKRFGIHFFPRNHKKTGEGLAAGMIVSFIAVLLVNLYFDLANWITAFGMATILACVYGIFDIWVTKFDDNLTNTFILGAIAWISYILLNLI
ncbi:MAG: hypothetical protein RBG13Loki_0664 [Promethearchaeota archaeon CR_4]|nr:MAG: hypothetical protein RBG13Loki_0664 [Candidatus Lokiarchaeota archaeon CR_4]